MEWQAISKQTSGRLPRCKSGGTPFGEQMLEHFLADFAALPWCLLSHLFARLQTCETVMFDHSIGHDAMSADHPRLALRREVRRYDCLAVFGVYRFVFVVHLSVERSASSHHSGGNACRPNPRLETPTRRLLVLAWLLSKHSYIHVCT